MATTTEPQTSMPPTLLTLPLEIRIMIYTLLAHHRQCYPMKRLRTIPGTRHVNDFSTPAEIYSTFPAQHPRHGRGPLTITSLQLTSRQIYRETRDLLTYPDLFMHLVADLDNKSTLRLATASARTSTLLRERFIGAYIYCECYSNFLSCCHCTKAKMPTNAALRWIWPELGYKLNHAIRKLLYPKALNRSSFHAAITSLEGFPRLKHIRIVVSHGDLLDWFRDPVRDFAIFVPFLRRGGVVRVIATLDRNLRGIKMNLWLRIADVLERSGGEVVMRDFSLMVFGLYGVDLKLRSG